MIPEARKDVLDALKEAIAAIKEKRHADLHAISDHVLHAITIYQDTEIVDVAVAIYVLDKLLEKEKYKTHRKMKLFVKTILHQLQKAVSELEKENYEDYSDTLKEILGNMESFSKSIKFYIEDIMHFARIKKGTKLYEHGLSLGKAAELAGVTKWELMPAIGETAIHEQFVTPRKINERRMGFAEKIFKIRKKKAK
jgi:gas vesicle protein